MPDGLAAKIRDARKQAKLSRMDVALALGVSMSTVVRIETGRADINYTRLVALARLTEKPLTFFLDEAAA